MSFSLNNTSSVDEGHQVILIVTNGASETPKVQKGAWWKITNKGVGETSYDLLVLTIH